MSNKTLKLIEYRTSRGRMVEEGPSNNRQFSDLNANSLVL